jgi:cysteine desulfurase/selenocysteine lyase
MNNYKKDFAIFKHHPDLIYLDSGATSLTPDCVLKKEKEYYTQYNANIARGVYSLSEKATNEYEKVRQITATFLNANEQEIIFTSGTTMSLNMIAFGLTNFIKKDDIILTTAMEHHANFIPWQKLAQEKKANFKIVNIDEQGRLDLVDLKNKIKTNTKILALTYVSNVLGIINPLEKIIKFARQKNPKIIIIVDAAQATPHLMLDVKKIDCDFLAFSTHKMLGPTGVGVLWGKYEKLELLKPMLTGGEMIDEVNCQQSSFTKLPHRLEAGTPNIAGVIAFGEALKYLQKIGLKNIQIHEKKLLKYAIKKIKENFGEKITIYGPRSIKERSGLISFTFQNYHPHDIASILDGEENVCVRAGMHCAMPLHREFLKIPATTRASFYFYNNFNDIDKLIAGLKKVEEILG